MGGIEGFSIMPVIPSFTSHKTILPLANANGQFSLFSFETVIDSANDTTVLSQNTVKLFTDTSNFKSNYLVDKDFFTEKPIRDKQGRLENVAIPVELDTEYVTTKLHEIAVNPEIVAKKGILKTDNIYKKLNLTLQVKGIHEQNGLIYAYPEFENASDIPVRHPVLKHPVFIGDYIESVMPSCSVEITRSNDIPKDLPVLTVVIYAYFAVAEFGGICSDPEFQADLNELAGQGKITMKRRLSTGRNQAVKTPWLIDITTDDDVLTYQIALQFIDCCALHGIASLKAVMSNVGLPTDKKDLMANWITKMDQAYFEVPDLYDEYALNDLCIYQVLSANYEKIRIVYESLGVAGYYKEPALTIGKLVSHLFGAVLAKKLNVTPAIFNKLTRKGTTEFFHKICGSATGNHLGAYIKTFTFLLAKVLGGRCKNNNPPMSVLKNESLCDVDIGGAYGWSQSTCDYFLGHPVTYAVSRIVKNTPKMSLRAFLDVFKDDMTPLAWTMCLSTSKPLEFEQDLIQSRFFSDSSIKPVGINDTAENNILIGETKYFSREIINGTLTSDLLDIVLNVLNKKQRDEFLDNCEVLCFAFYPTALKQDLEQWNIEKDDITKWVRYENKDKRLNGYQRIDTESNSFSTFNLGSVFINILRDERATHEKKTPLNELFKLIINTAYGSGISRFFESSNVIIGNNVTGRVRAVVYLMEKSLCMYGSITDGQFFNMCKVLYPHLTRGLNSVTFARMYSLSKRELNHTHTGTLRSLVVPFLPAKPFTGRVACLKCYKKHNLNGYQKRVNNAVKRHMINCFPKIVMLKEVVIEMKEFAENLILRSSSDYSTDPYSAKATKARGQELKKSKEHQAYDLIDGQCLKSNDYEEYNPALVTMQNIYENKHACKILPVALKMAMLKPTMYTRHYEKKWSLSNLGIGDEIPKIVTPSYLTMSQFMFLGVKQQKCWNKEHEKIKTKYSMGLELFYLNTDKNGLVTVDYQRMIIELDLMIRQGVINPFTHLVNQNPKMQNDNFARVVPQCIKNRAIIREHLKRSITSAILFDDEAFTHDEGGFDE